MTIQEAVEHFGMVLEAEGVTLVVIHLNDKSVEALFSTAPNMEQLQTQAQEATMFFVQGTNGTGQAVAPNLEFQLQQGDTELTTTPVNISNFEPGSEVPTGERYSGLIVADGLIDLGSPFVIQNGAHQFDFAFSPDQVALMADS